MRIRENLISGPEVPGAPWDVNRIIVPANLDHLPHMSTRASAAHEEEHELSMANHSVSMTGLQAGAPGDLLSSSIHEIDHR